MDTRRDIAVFNVNWIDDLDVISNSPAKARRTGRPQSWRTTCGTPDTATVPLLSPIIGG